MSLGFLRLGFGLVWFAVAAVILLRHPLGLDDFFARQDPQFLDMGGAFALALGGFNIVRFVLAERTRRKALRPVNSLERRSLPPEEYHPEFDFHRPPGDATK